MQLITAQKLSNQKAASAPKNILCLAFDRLNADFLGAYGNTWIETPGVDSLASESIVFDSYFTSSLDLGTLYRGFWRGESPADIDASQEPSQDVKSLFRSLKEQGYATYVVSDVEEITLHPAIEDDYCDGRFYLGAPDAETPVEALEDAKICRNFEDLTKFIAKLEDRAEYDEPRPWFIWAHFSGWNEVWDSPLDRRESYREDEEDPAPYAGVLPPFFDKEEQKRPGKKVVNDAEDEESPILAKDDLAELAPDDRRQSVVEAYAGCVSAFDETFEGFKEALNDPDLNVLPHTLLLLVGTRGMGTGDPSVLGVKPAGIDEADPNAAFYAEEVRAPLIVRLPDGTGATYRLPTLCEPRDVFETLRSWPSFSATLQDPEFWRIEKLEISPFAGDWGLDGQYDRKKQRSNASEDDKGSAVSDVPGQNLLTLLVDESRSVRERVIVVSKDAGSKERALVDKDYFLKIDPNPTADVDLGESLWKPRLYVRPDDRYCVNDVANRCVDDVERLEKIVNKR